MTTLNQTGTIAFWNKDSGAVWVEFDDGTPAEELADGIRDELAAYDALVRGGFSRRHNWMVVPGIPRRRSVDVFRAQKS